MEIENKQHWENVFANKQAHEMSWTQEFPTVVIDYISEINLAKDASIIDVGGGESNLAAELLKLGYTNISVLDISANAIEKAKQKMGNDAQKIQWVVSDITAFQPVTKYDFWYDRAVFHFLTEAESIAKYKDILLKSLNLNAHFLLGTFSENGPKKCSGLDIKQYSETNMLAVFQNNLQMVKCFKDLHTTPFNTTQEFQYCGFINKF